MPQFEIAVQGVTKLLEGLNGGKASGPEELSKLTLKNAANEISLTCVCAKSSFVNILCPIFRKTKC